MEIGMEKKEDRVIVCKKIGRKIHRERERV